MTKSSHPRGLNRRRFLRAGILSGAVVAAAEQVGHGASGSDQRHPSVPFELDEFTIAALQEGMKAGKFTARRRRNEADCSVAKGTHSGGN